MIPNNTKFSADGKNYIVVDGEIKEFQETSKKVDVKIKDKTKLEDTPKKVEVEKKEEKVIEDVQLAKEEKVEEVKEEKIEKVIDEAKDNVKEDAKEEIKKEEVKEEKMAEEVTTTIDEAKVLEIVQPKLDELYKIIADLKADLIQKDEEVDNLEQMSAETKLSIHDKFQAVMKFTKE